MISSEGSDVSICISRSVAFGKILFRSPRIGEIASPGREAIADTDHIASSTPSVIVPLPVLIFIASGFTRPHSKCYTKAGRAGMLPARPVVSDVPTCPAASHNAPEGRWRA